MVDTTDSKSVASNRVRVQVSSPVTKLPVLGSFFYLTSLLFITGRLELWLERELSPSLPRINPRSRSCVEPKK